MSAWPDLLPEDPNERAIFDDSAELHGSPLMAVWAQLNAASVMAPKQGSWGRYLAVMANEVRAAMIAQAALAAARAEGAEALRAACAGIAQGWLAQHGATNPEHISAQVWACDAVTDIIDGIRALPIPSADALARRDAWEPFVYASPPDGLCWLLVDRPETWFDAGDDGRDVGGYTGQMEMVVVLAEVYGTDTGPAFESVGYGDHGHVRDDDLVVSFIPLSAPSTPTIRARAVGEERQG